MAITGDLDYNITLTNYGMPAEFFGTVGDDGKHYIVASHDFAPGGSRASYVGNIDDDVVYNFLLTEALFQADVLALGLGAPFNGGTVRKGAAISVPGSNKILVLGYRTGSVAYEVYWVWYRVVSASTLTAVAGGHKVCGLEVSTGVNAYGSLGETFISTSGWSVAGASRILPNGNVYLMMQCGTTFAGIGRSNLLIEIPSTGIHVDSSAASWTPHLTASPYAYGFFNISSAPSFRDYAARAAIYDYGDSQHVGVFYYLGNYEGINDGAGGAVCYFTKYDYLNHTNNGKNNINSILGIPFSDTLRNRAGTLTTDSHNDYFSPTIIGTGIYFMRNYTDQPNYGGRRFFQLPQGDEIEDVIFGGFAEGIVIDADPSLNPAVRGVHGFIEGGIFYTMVIRSDIYLFGNMGAAPVISSRRWLAEPGPIRSIA